MPGPPPRTTGTDEPQDLLLDRQRTLRLLLHDGRRVPLPAALDGPAPSSWPLRLGIFSGLRVWSGPRAPGGRRRGSSSPQPVDRSRPRNRRKMKALYVTDRSAIG